MALPRLMWFLLLLTGLIASRPLYNKDSADCNGFQFKTEVSKVPNQEYFKLTIQASGGSRPYHYVLIDAKSKLVSTNFKSNQFDKLMPGKYRCVVADSQDCNVEQLIDVK
jgi:hypothetical protein